jgi:hypothetical protein
VTLEPIGPDLRHELGRLGPPGAIAEVVAAWPRAVGPAIAANAWPARIARDGALHVTVSSSAWAFELTQLAETIRARLAEELEIEPPARFRFAPGPVPEPGAEVPERAAEALPEPSQAVLQAARELADTVAEPGLRDAVERAAAVSLAAARDDRSF